MQTFGTRAVLIAAVPLLLFLHACTITLTEGGKRVQTVSEAQRSQCENLGLVTVEHGDVMDVGAAHRTQNSQHKLRNKIAETGGNAMKILSSETTRSGGRQKTVISAEALKCPE